MVKRRLYLNLRGLQVFEAVARHLSVTQAAAELGTTQSAASHQLRHLAEYLGETLIERQGRHISLTEAGQRLAEALDGAFDLIERTTATTIGMNRRMVRLALYPSFAMGWLSDPLPAFTAAPPDLDVQLVMMAAPPEISDRLADVFITSETPRRGYWSAPLYPELLVPVAQPPLARVWPDAVPLITTDIDPAAAGAEWAAFAPPNGLTLARLRRGPWVCCSHYLLALEMARAGMGVALVPDFLAAPAVARGAVQRLPGRPLRTGLSYEVQLKYERRGEGDIRHLVAWLRQAARRHAHEPDS